MLKMNGFKWENGRDYFVPAKLKFDAFIDNSLALTVVTEDQEVEIETITTNFASYMARDCDTYYPPNDPMEAEINRQLELVYSEKAEQLAEFLYEHGCITSTEPDARSAQGQVVWLFRLTDEATKEFIAAKQRIKEEFSKDLKEILQILTNEMKPWNIAHYWTNDPSEFLEEGLLDEEQVSKLRTSPCYEDLLLPFYKEELPVLTDEVKKAIEEGVNEYSTWGLISDWENGVSDFDYDKEYFKYQEKVTEDSAFTSDDALMAAYFYAVKLDCKRK